jgi:hypothetical protein
MTNRNYIITTESGVECLISGWNRDEALDAWDKAVAAGRAEKRVPGQVRRASRADVKRCAESGHDYRGA